MRYSISISRRAQKELADLPRQVQVIVVDAITDLAADPRPPGCRKLHGRDGWRIRVGDYRVLYDIDDHTRIATVFHIGNRRDVYR
jgi:mRNA interferase RelE/StbE